MSKRAAGKRLPESAPVHVECDSASGPSAPHLPDPNAPEWCIMCESWLGDGNPPDPDLCSDCFEPHADSEGCSGDYVCDICDMDGPMDGDQFDYGQLDPGIRQSVRFLRDHGFWTSDSGDGATKLGTDEFDPEDINDFGHVVIITEPRNMVEEARRAAAVLGGHGIQVQEQGLRTGSSLMCFHEDDKPTWDTARAVEISASYDPANDVAVIMLCYITDDLLAQHGIGVEHDDVRN